MLAVRGVCLLALVVMATAIDHSHVAIKRHMTKRKARSTHHVVHSNLAKLARAGVLSTSKSFALVNHAISSGSSFEGYEHAYGSGLGATSGGDEIQFHVIEVDGSSHGSLAVKNTASKVLVSSDDVDYAYAEMTAVAGDYWSVKDGVKNIICSTPGSSVRPKGGQEQDLRLKKAFADMWRNPDFGKTSGGTNYMPKLEGALRAMLDHEKNGVETTAKNDVHYGSKFYEPEAAKGGALSMAGDWITKELAQRIHKSFAKATSEGNLRALSFNDDHFAECAKETYMAGHADAMNEAFKAGQLYLAAFPLDKLTNKPPVFKADLSDVVKNTGDAKKIAQAASDLIHAYAMDGFVSHFLSDLFSAGHIRTPRVALRTTCPGNVEGDPSAGLTANVMHDEDNWNCLLVTNAKGMHWWACGDHRFFDDENAQNRRVLHDAVKQSVEDVAAAFAAGLSGAKQPAAVSQDFIPTTAGLPSRMAAENTCPMFELDKYNVLWIRDMSFPRPTKMGGVALGSSLRWSMDSSVFPKYKDIDSFENGKKETGTLNDNNFALTTTCNNRRFAQGGVLLNGDCCAVMGRAVPMHMSEPDEKVISTDSQKGSYQDTTYPKNKSYRSTYLNRCKTTQTVNEVLKKIM